MIFLPSINRIHEIVFKCAVTELKFHTQIIAKNCRVCCEVDGRSNGANSKQDVLLDEDAVALISFICRLAGAEILITDCGRLR